LTETSVHYLLVEISTSAGQDFGKSPSPPITTLPIHSMELSRFNYDQLDFGNYETWASYVEADLVGRDLFHDIIQITVDSVDAKGNELSQSDINDAIERKRAARSTVQMSRARAAIILRVKPSQLAHTTDPDPLNIWEELKAFHRPSGFATSMSLCRQMNGMKKSSSQTMAAWISAVKSIAYTMERAGASITTKDIIITLVDGLPSSYSHLVPTISKLNTSELTVEHVTSLLLSAEISHLGKNSTTSTTAPDPRNVALVAESEIRCHFCDKLGHIKQNCLRRKKYLDWVKLNEEKVNFVVEDSDDEAY